MIKLFQKADATTIKKTLDLYKAEIRKNKKDFIFYSIAIPINRLLYVVLLPLLFSLVIQSLISEPNNWQTPLLLLAVAVLVSIFALLSAALGFRKLFNHEEHMQTRLLETAMNSLMKHSDQFFSDRKVGSIAGDVTKFSHSIVSFLDVIFIHATGIIVNFSMSLVVIAFLSPILLLPLGIITGLIVWLSLTGTSRRAPLRNKRKLLTSKLNGTIADIIGNQQLVRFFATDSRELATILGNRGEIEKVARKEIDIIENESFKRQAVLFTFQIITMATCVWLYTNDNISIAALIFAITYMGRLTSSLFDISPIIRGLEQSFLDAAEITEILDEPIEVKDSPTARELHVTRGEVVFDRLQFSYKDTGSGIAINDLSLRIKPGEKIGLAGRSGGGKTTLTKLILRFADPTSGAVIIDGQDIRQVTQKSLRTNIAYVPQEAYLFHRSIRENVAYGKINATDEQVIDALKRANALDFVNTLPQGIDTVVGERGAKLSGGQRQRIAIARAILKDAPILVLDEATSALDSESEKLIQDALEKLMKGRTSIVIAHRLSTIAKLDRIIVMDNGQVIEDGTHAELQKAGGTYAHLWSHQSGGFIEE